MAPVRWYGPAGGGMDRPCWPGNGDVMGAADGVDRLGTTFVTMGTSFQADSSLAFDGVCMETGAGVLRGGPCGGAPNGVGGVYPRGGA